MFRGEGSRCPLTMLVQTNSAPQAELGRRCARSGHGSGFCSHGRTSHWSQVIQNTARTPFPCALTCSQMWQAKCLRMRLLGPMRRPLSFAPLGCGTAPPTGAWASPAIAPAVAAATCTLGASRRRGSSLWKCAVAAVYHVGGVYCSCRRSCCFSRTRDVALHIIVAVVVIEVVAVCVSQRGSKQQSTK